MHRLAPLALGLLLAACAPALDWRELREADAQLALQFPCKPQRVAEGAMGLLQCEASDSRFVLSWKRFDSPQALQQEVAAQAPRLAERLQARAQPLPGGLPGGAMVMEGSGRYRLAGAERSAWVLVWARGLTLHQALVTAARADAETSAQLFFDGMKPL